jgi:hypothetical protein
VQSLHGTPGQVGLLLDELLLRGEAAWNEKHPAAAGCLDCLICDRDRM